MPWTWHLLVSGNISQLKSLLHLSSKWSLNFLLSLQFFNTLAHYKFFWACLVFESKTQQCVKFSINLISHFKHGFVKVLKYTFGFQLLSNFHLLFNYWSNQGSVAELVSMLVVCPKGQRYKKWLLQN
jgi:hypothetical protein